MSPEISNFPVFPVSRNFECSITKKYVVPSEKYSHSLNMMADDLDPRHSRATISCVVHNDHPSWLPVSRIRIRSAKHVVARTARIRRIMTTKHVVARTARMVPIIIATRTPPTTLMGISIMLRARAARITRSMLRPVGARTHAPTTLHPPTTTRRSTIPRPAVRGAAVGWSPVRV